MPTFIIDYTTPSAQAAIERLLPRGGGGLNLYGPDDAIIASFIFDTVMIIETSAVFGDPPSAPIFSVFASVMSNTSV